MSTVANLNGTRVAFRTAHRDENYSTGPAVATMLAPPIELSYEDLVAALFRWEWVDADELSDDAHVRALIVESVVNCGCLSLDTARDDVIAAANAPGSDANAWLQVCRQRVTDLFMMPASTVVAELYGTPTPRRELATAGQAVTR